MLGDPMLLRMSELETERLLLREFRSADRSDVAQWEDAPHPEEFLEFCFRSYREWGLGPWAMLLKERAVIVGNCSFCRIHYQSALGKLEYCGDINYYVAPQFRDAGFATEALKAVLEFGFRDLRLTRIQGRCASENISSERVMQKAGLKLKGLKLKEMKAASPEASPQEKLYAIDREDFSRLP
jgi:ribosomal-protein-alanine N-acetyltransferase